MSAQTLVRSQARRLSQAGIPTALLEAELLLCHVMGWERETLLRAPERDIPAGEQRRLEGLIQSRLTGIPLARLLGSKEFWSLPFRLCADTLIPRPDSETLVAAALEAFPADAPWRILDLGCGSGCLLLALLSGRPRACGIGVDCSAAAVETARRNAEALRLDGAAQFRQGDWNDGPAGIGASPDTRFDLILANPPYIPSADIPALQIEVRDHEPRRALDGGADGMESLRHIISVTRPLLRPGGRLLLEVGAGQAAAVSAHMERHGFTAGGTRRDLAGIERVVIGIAPENMGNPPEHVLQ